MPLVATDAVSKSFAGIQALRNVSFELQAGEVHALAGENGAGKSTILPTSQRFGGNLHQAMTLPPPSRLAR